MLYEMNSEILDASRELFYDESAEFPIKEVVEYLRASEVTKRLVRNLFLHVADVSNPFKPFKVCRIWTWQVLEEFFLQGGLRQSRSRGSPQHCALPGRRTTEEGSGGVARER